FSMIKHATSIFPANYINEQFSYPSGHAARAVFIGVITYLAFSIYHLALRKRLLFGFCLGLYVFLVSVSRVYLGHHWFSDIIGGVLLASGFAFAVLMFAPVDGQDKPHYNRKVHE
ncbi:MAG: phosphatase PAP2 family protein, partial [Candidatus Woesebacteria bacterium]|nr:phosphatase PAP2 family protein [Candidatus Woesebacteria bacterium]